MNERQIKLQLIEKADLIAKSLAKGKGIEIKKQSNGILVAEVSRKTMK